MHDITDKGEVTVVMEPPLSHLFVSTSLGGEVPAMSVLAPKVPC